jgi:predicted O-methyltransferase YrrM
MEQNIFLKELKKKSQARNIPNISEENAKFLVDLIKKNNYKKILEIGTANGYSSICLAYEIQK